MGSSYPNGATRRSSPRRGFQPGGSNRPIQIPPRPQPTPNARTRLQPYKLPSLPGARAGAMALFRRFLLGRLFLPLGIALDLLDLYNLYKSMSAHTWPGASWNSPGYYMQTNCGRPFDSDPNLAANSCSAFAFSVIGATFPAGAYNPATDPAYSLHLRADIALGSQRWLKSQTWAKIKPGALPAPPPPGFLPVPRYFPDDNPMNTPVPQPLPLKRPDRLPKVWSYPYPKYTPDQLPAPLVKAAPEHLPWKWVRWTREPDIPAIPRDRSVRGPVRSTYAWPRTVTRVVTNTRTKITPADRKVEPPHRPPPARTKERKIMMATGWYRIAKWAINAATEYTDYLDALWYALPRKFRKKGYSPNPYNRTLDVLGGWDHIDWGKAFRNLILNEIGDRIAGGIGKAFKKAYRNNPYMTRPVGVQAGPADDYWKQHPKVKH